MRRRDHMLLPVAFALALPGPARAENCTKDTVFSVAESTPFAGRVGPLVQSALPPAPQGWKRQEGQAFPGSVGCGWVSRIWNVTYRAAGDAPSESGTDLPARMREAASRGDAAEVKRLQQEMMQKQSQRADQLKQSMPADADAYRKESATISITVNEALDSLAIPNPKASSVSPPQPIQVPGADLAFRSPDYQSKGGYWNNGVTTLYLGKWKSQQVPGHLQQTVEMPKSGRDTKVHTIRIVVKADDKRAEELVSAFDWKALRALVEP